LGHPAAPKESTFLRSLLRSFRRPAEPSGAVGIKHAQRALALCHALLAERGEVSAAKLAAEAPEACISRDDSVLELLWDGLADQFLPDQERARQAAEVYADDPSPISLMQLQMAVESPRQEL